MIPEIIVLTVLAIMAITYFWFLSLSSEEKYPTANRILWNVLGIGFAVIMITVLITVIWLE